MSRLQQPKSAETIEMKPAKIQREPDNPPLHSLQEP